MAPPGYGRDYQAARREVLRGDPPCAYACGRAASTADHVPPLSAFAHPDLWVGVLVPSCLPCAWRQGGRIARARQALTRRPLPTPSRRW